MSLIAANGSGEGSASSDSAIETSGTIKTIAQAVIEGNSHFYLTLDGDSRIYDFALPGMLNVVSYAVGDTITFRYVEGDPTSAQKIVERPSTARRILPTKTALPLPASRAGVSDGSASGEEAHPVNRRRRLRSDF
ncbi:MAG: hypothetical protein ACLT98_04050 [Eggerthellaceae bacterium]